MIENIPTKDFKNYERNECATERENQLEIYLDFFFTFTEL